MQRLRIEKENTLLIVCPNCQNSKRISLDRIKGKFRFAVRCICDSIFKVEVELRGKNRRQIDIGGYFEIDREHVLQQGGKIRWNSRLRNPRSQNCRIANLSAGGLGLVPTVRHSVEIGDILRVVFNLNNSAQTPMDKRVIVRNLLENYIACEFTDEDKADTAIGFFMLTKEDNEAGR